MRLENSDSREQISHRKWLSPDMREIVITKLEDLRKESHNRTNKQAVMMVSPDRMGQSATWNGFTFGIDKDEDRFHSLSVKYLYMECAERHAIYQAARAGCALQGAVMISTTFPCPDCARAIVMSGIEELYFIEDLDNTKINTNFDVSKEILSSGRVKFELL